MLATPHPIPYQGSKRALAEKILTYFPPHTKMLAEPFTGSAAISIAAARAKSADKFILNDLNKPLVALLREIVEHPDKIADKYENLWKEQLSDPQAGYCRVRDIFNRDGKPEHFLYLLVRCVKASVRYNANGEFNQSPDNRRLGTRPSAMRANIFGMSRFLKGKTFFSSLHYREFLERLQPGTLVYMDPPYQGVCGNRDSRYLGGIREDEFIETLSELNQKDVEYLVSYDGRTGGKSFGIHLPIHLDLLRVELPAGWSTQSTLLGRREFTYESLYISRALRESLAVASGRNRAHSQLEFSGMK